MDEFAWSKHQAVLYNNICYAGLAVIAIGSFVVVKIITKWSVEVLPASFTHYPPSPPPPLILAGLMTEWCSWWPCLLLPLGSLLSYRWAVSTLPSQCKVGLLLLLLVAATDLYSHNDIYIIDVGVEGQSEMANGSTAFVVEKSLKLVGCRYPMQHWCISVPRIYLFQYVIALVLIAVGYPTASVMCYAIYSKILGPTKQVLYTT